MVVDMGRGDRQGESGFWKAVMPMKESAVCSFHCYSEMQSTTWSVHQHECARSNCSHVVGS